MLRSTGMSVKLYIRSDSHSPLVTGTRWTRSESRRSRAVSIMSAVLCESLTWMATRASAYLAISSFRMGNLTPDREYLQTPHPSGVHRLPRVAPNEWIHTGSAQIHSLPASCDEAFSPLTTPTVELFRFVCLATVIPDGKAIRPLALGDRLRSSTR